ncbi:10695_t:CDS:2, partial [Gigaspora margarita]
MAKQTKKNINSAYMYCVEFTTDSNCKKKDQIVNGIARQKQKEKYKKAECKRCKKEEEINEHWIICEKNKERLEKLIDELIRKTLRKINKVYNTNRKIITNLLKSSNNEIDIKQASLKGIITKRTVLEIKKITKEYKEKHDFTTYFLYKINKKIYKDIW